MSKKDSILKKFSTAADIILLVIFIPLITLSAYSIYDQLYLENHARDNSILDYKPKLLGDGSADSSGAIKGSVAWLTIKNTNIDQPIMQGKDNTEYLNKDPYGNFSLSGSLFLDSRCKPDFTDEYSLIYGHHMEKDLMFGALDKYQNLGYLKKHDKGDLIVGSKVYKLKIYACATINGKDSIIFNPEQESADLVNGRIQTAEEKVIDESIDISGKKVIALSTCQAEESDDRTVVFAIIE